MTQVAEVLHGQRCSVVLFLLYSALRWRCSTTQRRNSTAEVFHDAIFHNSSSGDILLLG